MVIPSLGLVTMIVLLAFSIVLICDSVLGGRLECTMQNIADNFTNTHSSRCYKGVEGLELCPILCKLFTIFVFTFVLTWELSG